jgi:predicted ATPase/DNA-binding XRE family transcriptional regulator
MDTRQPGAFGSLLRRTRRAVGLTQAEMAERAGVSVRTISDLERGVSHTPHKDTIAFLAETLGLLSDDRQHFESAARPIAPEIDASTKNREQDDGSVLVDASRPPSQAYPTNLPRSLTRLIGREQEQAAIANLLGEVPLLTLTGAGGCGKTRLALRVAGDRVAAYPDGVWLVELAPLASAPLIPQAIAVALGVSEEPGRLLLATLTAFLGRKRLLLVLDNCEHLVASCADLATALLRVCPQLQILATSREALGIEGERAWKVPSLSLPDPRQPVTVAHLLDAAAVRLFLERASASRPSFALTARNADLVAQVCRRLDGIPLALELAAARLSALSLDQIAARLDNRFHLLTRGRRDALPRQQTLRATLDWSYALLDETERALLRRLAVFAGGWTLEAAEGVCAGDGIAGEAVVDLLTGLVNKSLAVLDESEDTGERGERYRLLETVRQYAGEKLVGRGEATAVRGRHLIWYLTLAEQAEPALYTSGQGTCLNRLGDDLDNLRAALRWGQEPGEMVRGMQLARALGGFWDLRNRRSEGLRWLREILAVSAEAGTTGRAGGDGEMTSVRAWTLVWAGYLALMQSETTAARELTEQSLALFQDLGDPAGRATALDTLGSVARDGGDFGRAVALQEESVALWRELGDAVNLGNTLYSLGITVLQRGDSARAAALTQESAALWRGLGDPAHAAARTHECLSVHPGRTCERAATHHLFLQGQIAWELGDLKGAQALGEESMDLFRQAGDRQRAAGVLGILLGQVTREQGGLERAMEQCEESLALGRGLGDDGVIGWASLGLGLAACEQGHLVRARTALVEGLSLFWVRGMKWFTARCLAGLAAVDAEEGTARRAARLAGATEALLSFIGASLPRGERASYGHAVDAARSALGDDAFADGFAAGHALPLEVAVMEALGAAG